MLLLIGYAVVHFLAGGMKVKPHLLGKVATVLQMAVVLWPLFKWNERGLHWLCVAAAAFTVGSALIYLFVWMRLVAKHPSSAAVKDRDGGK